MKQFNNPILSILEDKLPVHVKPVQYLMDTLGISKESAYRRMRNQIPFSFDEVALLCRDLHFSIDRVIGSSDTSTGVFFQINQTDNNEDTIYNFFVNFTNDLEFIVRDSRSEIMLAINRFPLWCMPIKSLQKLDYCKRLYSKDKINVLHTFQDIEIPSKLNEQYGRTTRLMELIPNLTVLIDNNVFQKIVDEIKYFYTIKFLTKDDVEVLQKGALELLEYYTTVALTGKNRVGYNYQLYLSNLSVDANVCYYTSNKSEISEIWLYNDQKIHIENNPVINTLHKNWIQSQIKFASFITSSNDIVQREFFQKTYSLINTLTEIYQ